MDIVKKFKDFFKKEEDRPRYMNIPTGNKHQCIHSTFGVINKKAKSNGHH